MRIALVLLLLLGACAAQVEYQHSVYLPVVMSAPAKKGVGLFAGGCDVLELLDVDWYYTGPKCEGYERVEYISHPAAIGREPTPCTLLFNEPIYQQVSIEYMVDQLVPYMEKYPDTVWVGPCPAYDLGLVTTFWDAFEQRAGYAMPPEKIRICVHCYYDAAECLRQIDEAGRLGDSMGIPQPNVWLTEFGQILGFDMTIRQQVDEMRKLIEGLEADPGVERYAYWPGLLRPGREVPNGASSAWQPLTYDWYDYNLKTVIGVRLTDVGQMYKER